VGVGLGIGQFGLRAHDHGTEVDVVPDRRTVHQALDAFVAVLVDVVVLRAAGLVDVVTGDAGDPRPAEFAVLRGSRRGDGRARGGGEKDCDTLVHVIKLHNVLIPHRSIAVGTGRMTSGATRFMNTRQRNR